MCNGRRRLICCECVENLIKNYASLYNEKELECLRKYISNKKETNKYNISDLYVCLARVNQSY